MLPFWTLVAIGFGALLCGWVGGLGGRAWRDRHRYAETEERFEALERRLSRREGQAGQRAKRENPEHDLAELAQLARLAGAGSTGAGAPRAVPDLDPTAMDAEATRHFRKKDQTG